MADQTSPMAARRRLGAELRALREAAGISGEQAAAVLDGSQAKISRMESGITRPSVRDVRELLELYQADPVKRDELLSLAAAAAVRNPAWWNDYAGVLPSQFKRRAALEADATTILHFQPNVVPGLLQTSDYARAVMTCAGNNVTRENLDLAIAFRVARREQLMRKPPRFHVIITEQALRWRPSTPEVHSEQMWSLVEELRSSPSLSMRLLPEPAPDGVFPQSDFIIYKFSDPAVPTAAYVEIPTGYVEIEKQAEITYYEEAFSKLLESALSVDESLRVIEKLAESYH